MIRRRDATFSSGDRQSHVRGALLLKTFHATVMPEVEDFHPLPPGHPLGPVHDLHFGAGRYGPQHVLAAIDGFSFGSRS